jgi:hypothetical protein
MKYKIDALMAKEIRRNRYSKFYHINTKEAMPLMGMFFYDIYRNVEGYQKTLLRAEKSQVLKEIIFSRFLDETGRELLVKISENYIKDAARTQTTEELTISVKTNTAAVERHFNETWRQQVDDVFVKIHLFSWFINYDYTGFLHKFTGSPVQESLKNKAVKIEFDKVKSAAIIEHLKDFLSLTAILFDKVDWHSIFSVLSAFDEHMPSIETWIKVYPSLLNVLKSNIFTLLIRHSEGKPDWEIEPVPLERGFAYEYLMMLITRGNNTLSEIQRGVKSGMIEKLVTRVFQDSTSSSAGFYNNTESEAYISDGYSGFSEAQAFDYLLTFFHVYCEKIRELINIIIIKATWSSRDYSSELSQNMLGINSCFQDLSVFDRSFADNGERGVKMRAYFSKASIGKRHKEYLRKYFDTVNSDARDIIDKTMQILTQFLNQLTAIEIEKQNHQQGIIRNWTELDFLLKECMPLPACIKKLSDLAVLIRYVRTNEIFSSSEQ